MSDAYKLSLINSLLRDFIDKFPNASMNERRYLRMKLQMLDVSDLELLFRGIKK